MIVSQLLNLLTTEEGWRWKGERFRNREGLRKRMKNRSRKGGKVFYRLGAAGGLSQLCGHERLFVHNCFRITSIFPPASFLTPCKIISKHENVFVNAHKQQKFPLLFMYVYIFVACI